MTNEVLGLTVKRASEVSGFSTSWLNQLRSKGGDGPAYVKIGRKVVYRPEDLKAWLDSHVKAIAA